MSKSSRRTLATIALISTVIAEQKAVSDQSIWWAMAVGVFAMITVRLIMGPDSE